MLLTGTRRVTTDRTRRGIVDCQHARHAIAARLFGSLDEPERAAVDEHLDSCADCRGEFLELREVLPALDLVRPHEADGLRVPDPQRAIDAARAATRCRRSD
ncbi:zf-HC2 domain-containing protein [Streptomyces sp. YS415]|uniref:zf-HC2 domain-containing protein n=1 Tax=Streptomyces sp. YS415 TaxID=2944806 RepID=UPI0020215BC4|nr:zf-HC2 domain-containing protein [Streptomyces sp. YS415]MCL7429373.1 zf-HC2 domain-containing protein [Streptomyces sp. YS415]